MKIIITRKKSFAGFLIPYICGMLDEGGVVVGESYHIKNGRTVTIESDERAAYVFALAQTSTGRTVSEPYELPTNADLLELELVTHYSPSKGSILELKPLNQI